VFLLLTFNQSIGQGRLMLSGKVYDVTKSNPIEAVSVITTSGRGTVTDSAGSYRLLVQETDSVYFSYLNKPTQKFAVSKVLDPSQFDISIHITVTEFRTVTVRPRNYRQDSIQNRMDYAKIFEYKKPGISTSGYSPSAISGGVGFDLGEIINIFRFKRNKRLLKLQQRLLEQEQDKFINNRFTKRIVLKLTKMAGPEADTFMLRYRPSYAFTARTSDIDFYRYIQIASKHYKQHRNISSEKLKRELAFFFMEFEPPKEEDE
jgi:hypothetical protein